MTILNEATYLGDVLKSESQDEHRRSRELVTVKSGENLAICAMIGKITKAQAAVPIPAVSGTGNGVMTLLKPGKDVQTGSYLITCTAVVAHGGVFSVVAPDGTVLPSLTLTPGAGGTTAYSSTHLNFSITDGSTDFALADVFTVVVTAGGTPVCVGTGDGVMSLMTLGKDATYAITCIEAIANGGIFEVIAPDGTALKELLLNAGSGNTTAYASEQVNFSITDDTDFVVGDYFNLVVAAGSGEVVELEFAAVDGSQNAAGFMVEAKDASSAAVQGVIIARDAVIVSSRLAWPTGATSAEKATAIEQLATLGIIARAEA